MKTATITYHASHNYGSMLQAYALQSFLTDNSIDNEIINFRTDRQRDLYSLYTKRKGIKYQLKNLSHYFYKKKLTKKINNFEEFLSKNLKTTLHEYKTIDELEKARFIYDIYISGGDQIWNPEPADFDWAYYLPFVKSGKKISYSVSFGQLSSRGNEETCKKIKKYLKDYDAIGVREKGSKINVEEIANLNSTLTVDPVFLINKDRFISLEKKVNNLPENGYILFYTLFANRERRRIIKHISKVTKLPIVSTNFSNQYDVFNRYIKHYEAGPKEFLYLLHHASLVVTSSFHGTALSIIYGKEFWSIGGLEDARISSLLSSCDLKSRSISINNYKKTDYNNSEKIDYFNVYSKQKVDILKSKEYLLKFLKESDNDDN